MSFQVLTTDLRGSALASCLQEGFCSSGLTAGMDSPPTGGFHVPRTPSHVLPTPCGRRCLRRPSSRASGRLAPGSFPAGFGCRIPAHVGAAGCPADGPRPVPSLLCLLLYVGDPAPDALLIRVGPGLESRGPPAGLSQGPVGRPEVGHPRNARWHSQRQCGRVIGTQPAQGGPGSTTF